MIDEDISVVVAHAAHEVRYGTASQYAQALVRLHELVGDHLEAVDGGHRVGQIATEQRLRTAMYSDAADPDPDIVEEIAVKRGTWLSRAWHRLRHGWTP